MKLKPILCALVVLGATTSPSFALYCSNSGPSAGVIIEFRNGKTVHQTDTEGQAELDRQRLRAIGVDARSVERWAGCMRAFVAQPGGGETMEFYDPGTLQRLQ